MLNSMKSHRDILMKTRYCNGKNRNVQFLGGCICESGHLYIPEDIMFKTKPQLALEMIHAAIGRNPFTFKWVGCDGAYGCDPEFRKGLPETVLFFADVHASQHVYRTRPEWTIPQYSGRGKKPTKLVPSTKSVSVRDIANDSDIPWHTIVLMEGSKGPVITQVKWCRIIESLDGKDGDELWLYIRKYNDGTIKYSFSNASADIEIGELHHAAKLRWPIEQSFQECKSFLGMGHYETRSYIGWHRHMLLVMVSHLFVTEVRMRFKKKTNEPVLTMHQACILIISSMSGDKKKIKHALNIVSYYQKNNAKAYMSHRKRRLLDTA